MSLDILGDLFGWSCCCSQHVGCDGVVGSAKLVDACGVCGGDNSTCRVVSGLFTRPQLPVGYNLIAQIPRGACNITISELKQSRNYLGKWALLLQYLCYYRVTGPPFASRLLLQLQFLH
jgi:hypothetical protein